MNQLICIVAVLSVGFASAHTFSAAIDLTGNWIHQGDAAEKYTIVRNPANPSNFSATCVAGGCTTWTKATIAILNETTGSCWIDFTGEHRNHTGHVNIPSTSSISWSDNSVWSRAGLPPGVSVDVVVVPHTHDDAGWQRTFEGYYLVEVSKIIANVIDWLDATPNARFIYVESSFLQRWWVDANATQRNRFTAHVVSGRLELVGGGWTMHDEESTTIYSQAANMEYGLTWLARTFGAKYKPRVLWQIDPSGHALVTPTITAEMGFNALVIDRIPDPVRQAFRVNQSLQFVWTGSATHVNSTPSVLATVLDSFYCNPNLGGSTPAERAASFYADIARRVDSYRPDSRGHITVLWPWGCDFAFQSYSDFASLTGVVSYMSENPTLFPNVTARFGTLSEYFTTLHAQDIAFPTQGKRDFHPYRWCFEPENPGLCYNLPSTPDPAYWRTGMYTSKAELKGNSRTLDMSLHAADAAYAMLQLASQGIGNDNRKQTSEKSPAVSQTISTELRSLRANLKDRRSGVPSLDAPAPPQPLLPALCTGRATSGLMTHHDAITGTAYVTCSLGPPDDDCNCYEDYMLRMANATASTENVIASVKGALLAKSATTVPQLGNATAATAKLTASNTLIIAVGNPLAWARREIVRLPLLQSVPSGYSANVIDTRSPTSPVISQVVTDAARSQTQTLYWVADVPPLATVVYSITLVPTPFRESYQYDMEHVGEVVTAPLTLSNGAISVQFDANGWLTSWTNVSSNITFPVDHDFLSYTEHLPTSNLIGGTVYGFEPVNNTAPSIVGPNKSASIPLLLIANGPLVYEAAQQFTPWLTHSIRLFASNIIDGPVSTGYAAALPLRYTIESQTRIGPLPFVPRTGGSVVHRFTPGSGCTVPGATSAATQLMTDTSGFQNILRPAYDPTLYIQGQVYPTYPGWDWRFSSCDGSGSSATPAVLSHIASGRPMGTAVQSNVSVWQMLARRLNNPDDLRGNETTILDDIIVLAIADATADWSRPTTNAVQAPGYLLQRQVTARLRAAPLTLHGNIFASFNEYSAIGSTSYSPAWLTSSLPPTILLHSLVSRDGWYPPSPVTGNDGGGNETSGTQLVIRFQQLPFAPPVTFDLSKWLSASFPATVQEVTIDLTEDKASADAARFKWRTLSTKITNEGEPMETTLSHDQSEDFPSEHVLPITAPIPIAFDDAEYVRSYLLTLTK